MGRGVPHPTRGLGSVVSSTSGIRGGSRRKMYLVHSDVLRGSMASAEREHIIGVWGRSPHGVRCKAPARGQRTKSPEVENIRKN